MWSRSSRPSQRGIQEPNDSGSSGEEDDDDGFEILTAENLFSTLLSRVRFTLLSYSYSIAQKNARFFTTYRTRSIKTYFKFAGQGANKPGQHKQQLLIKLP